MGGAAGVRYRTDSGIALGRTVDRHRPLSRRRAARIQDTHSSTLSEKRNHAEGRGDTPCDSVCRCRGIVRAVCQRRTAGKRCPCTSTNRHSQVNNLQHHRHHRRIATTSPQAGAGCKQTRRHRNDDRTGTTAFDIMYRHSARSRQGIPHAAIETVQMPVHGISKMPGEYHRGVCRRHKAEILYRREMEHHCQRADTLEQRI